MKIVNISTITITLLFSIAAFAETPIIESENFTLSTGAYLSSYFLYTQLDYDIPTLPDTQASSSNLLRIESRGKITDHVSFDIHNRLFFRTANASMNGLGLGSTQIPNRRVDLRSAYSENGLLLEHDIDRLAFTIFTPLADFTIGRQAVTWGNSTFFALNDLWTQFSPFESDTSQKRGVDAIRAIVYPTDEIELEFILLDRGPDEDLSKGLKLSFSLGKGEYYFAGVSNYETLEALGGMAMEIGDIRTHADVNLPYQFDNEEFLAPSFSVGADYFSSKLIIAAEYFFNGYGVEKNQYLWSFLSARVKRGQAYLVGDQYMAATIGYLPIPELTLSLLTISNLLDPSAMLSPSLSYQASTEATVSLGAFVGIGKRPQFDELPPKLHSEFGLSGYSFFLQISTFL